MSTFNADLSKFLTELTNRLAQLTNDLDHRRVAVDAVLPHSMLSTVMVNDGKLPYETALLDARYYDKLIIVEAYDNVVDATAGHQRWLRMCQTDTLPDAIQECVNAKLRQLLEAVRDGPTIFTRKDRLDQRQLSEAPKP